MSVNSNYCNNLNLWLLLQPRDPAGHLTWLVSELAEAERAGSKVFIISHIPPGSSSCLAAWSHQYSRIVTRYSNVITGQFYGHTHLDEFSILYNSSNPSQPISVGFTAPSLTPHDGLNPGYRIFLSDSSRPDASHALIDHHTFSLDLTQANLDDNNKSLKYTLEYSALRSLNLEDMSPTSWNKYVNKLVENDEAWALFYKRYSRNGPATDAACDSECKKNTLCRLVTFDSSDKTHCENIIEKNIDGDESEDWWDEEF